MKRRIFIAGTLLVPALSLIAQAAPTRTKPTCSVSGSEFICNTSNSKPRAQRQTRVARTTGADSAHHNPQPGRIRQRTPQDHPHVHTNTQANGFYDYSLAQRATLIGRYAAPTGGYLTAGQSEYAPSLQYQGDARANVEGFDNSSRFDSRSSLGYQQRDRGQPQGSISQSGSSYNYYGPINNDFDSSNSASSNGDQVDTSIRDRLDPWHGYNAHNGLGNGY
jgi:hypothetical protein